MAYSFLKPTLLATTAPSIFWPHGTGEILYRSLRSRPHLFEYKKNRINEQMSKKVFFLIVLALYPLLKNQGMAQNSTVESSKDFLEKTIEDMALVLIDSLDNLANKHYLLSLRTRTGKNDALDFVRDILVQKFLIAGLSVYFDDERSPTTSLDVDKFALTKLELVLEEWDLLARKREKNPAKHRIVLEFMIRLRYHLIQPGGKVLVGGDFAKTATKLFRDVNALYRAQEAQPGFAQARIDFSTTKNNFLSTLLIASATGVTIFLIYSLRSQ